MDGIGTVQESQGKDVREMSEAAYERAITKAQLDIIKRGEDRNYPLEDSIADIDVIADLTELKIRKRKEML